MRPKPLQPISPRLHAATRLAPFFRLVSLLALITLIVFSVHQAQAAPAAESGFRGFVESLWPQAQARGVTRATFDAAFQGVVPNPKLIALTRKQAEFVKPVWDYLAGAVSAKRIARGQERAREFKDTLGRAESQYGVERAIVMGVWGLETDFGSFSGGDYVIRSLATLAYARYRGDFFKTELLTALQILQEGHITPANMTGSWAGAMGQTQFMPSSFVAYAVDFNNDGRKDIWTSVPDALGSTANYLKAHGWIAGETWGYEVNLPKGFSIAAFDPAHFTTLARFADAGVTRADGEAIPRSGEAALLLPAGLRGPVFLVTPNFKVIKSYNNSTSYALGVALLGDRIAGEGPLHASWPRGDKTLNHKQALELQTRLQQLGHDVGTLDGHLGEKASQALRAWQIKAGMEPDGYPTLAILEKMRKAK